MRHITHALLVASVLLAACGGSSHGGDDDDDDDRCAMVRECFPAESVGCCGATATRVSVCDACPMGMLQRTSCRTTGCTNPCMSSSIIAPDSGSAGRPAPAVTCFVDNGPGCCGAQVFNADMCGACPMGSKAASQCTTPAEMCACGGSSADPAPGGGAPAEPVPGPGSNIQPASEMCFQQLSSTCCGMYVGVQDSCGRCPAGSVPSSQCTSFPSDADRPAAPRCRADHGGGCCGDIVAGDACGTGCPTGAILETSCTDFESTDGGTAEPPAQDGGSMEFVPPEDGGAGVPAPLPECRMNLDAMGCCGEIVPMRACGRGTCPEGSIFSYMCTAYAPACGG